MSQIPGVTDALQPEGNDQKYFQVTLFDFILIGISIFLYVVSLPLEIKLAVELFTEGNVWFGSQTVLYIVLPRAISTLFSIWWYRADVGVDTPEDSKKLRIVRRVFTYLMMGRLMRKLDQLYYTIKCRTAPDTGLTEADNLRMKLYAIDFSILAVFDACMASGPQSVLQMYIFAKHQASSFDVFTQSDWERIGSIVASLFTLSSSYAFYQRSMRIGLGDRKELNKRKTFYVFLWRLFDAASRVICLGLFASVFPYWIVLVCCTHYIGMFIWIRKMKTNFLKNKKKELLYNLVLAEVFVFFYFNPKKQPTQSFYTVYYVVMFLENTALMCLWYCHYPPVGFRLIALILQFSSFFFSIVLMVIYYYFLHPHLGKCTQKSKRSEDSSETQMKNFETNANSGENENMNV